ncbi:hypothetical protein Gohar_027278 [Gossypium harknessii]|uniref:DUF4283 domain-containing protein n=1 Tax=Gossypium harknessii TaxID=34285 RepID=A0A7J9HU93_9ROSI|nr:hypothetical protein [Gossypium harknessii]
MFVEEESVVFCGDISMEEELANINIADDEEEPVQAVGDELGVEEDYSLCMVGWVLIDNVVDFPSIRNTLVDLWHPLGEYLSQILGRRENFIGQFMEYDNALVARRVRKYIRIRYEKITLFYFLCDILGHGEDFYPVRSTLGEQEVEFDWDSSLRDPPRRPTSVVSRWLREDPGDGVRIGMERLDGYQGKTGMDDIQSKMSFFNVLVSEIGPNMSKGMEQVVEERPIEFIKGKKMQGVQGEGQPALIINEAKDLEYPNEISMATRK